MGEDLLPFYTHNDLYLQPIYKILIIVKLPKMRQVGQSISNWEIRERLKKMLTSIELSDFKVLESSLEEVQFAAIVNNSSECRKVVRILNNVSFRAIGFCEPLTVTVSNGKLDFPTRTDWNKFFSENASDESNPGERPDTIYIGGLPFEWFKHQKDLSYEDLIKQIFSQFGEVRCVDIPQCDPFRREMDNEISGIRLSLWSFGEDTFFEAYVQFKEYNGFVEAIEALSGKRLVQKVAGALRQTQLKVDFDKTAHLSARKIKLRKLKQSVLQNKAGIKSNSITESVSSTTQIVESIPSTSAGIIPLLSPPQPPILENKKRKKSETSDEITEQTLKINNSEKNKKDINYNSKLKRQLMRAERRKKREIQKQYEIELRKKLKLKFSVRQKDVINEREKEAKRLLLHISELHKTKNQKININQLASDYVREQGLVDEDELRKRLLLKRQLKKKCT